MDRSQAVRTKSGWKLLGAARARAARRTGAIVLCGLLASVGWGAADPNSSTTGLRGIVPGEPPEELTTAISQLPENWAKWGESLSTDLSTLYGTSELDVAGQRKLLATLKSRLKVAKTALEDRRYASMRDTLVTLHDGLARRIEVLEAVLDTLELDPAAVKAAQLQGSSADVLQAAKGLEAYLKPIRKSEGWVKYFQIDQIINALEPAPKPDAAALLKTVQARFDGKSQLNDPKTQEFLSAPPFAALDKAVDSYLSAAALNEAPVNVEELRNQLSTLVTNLEAYESSASSGAAGAVRKAFNSIRKDAPDGGAKISHALQENYFNYNLRISASEGLLKRLMTERHQEASGVTDYVLGANVSGNQNTSTVVGVDLLPSNQGAKFAITVDGTVTSSTAGTTSQATIYTSGYHTFHAAKEVDFDGNRFVTHPATIAVNASNTTTGADTNVGPLFRGFANNIAMREAEARRPESEAIAASRIQGRVVPRFNEEVDKEFARANTDLKKKLVEPLKQLHLYPDAYTYRTTADQLVISSRLMHADDLAGSEPIPSPTTPNGLTVMIHESLINNSLDQMELAGKTLTESDIRALLEDRLSKVLGRKIKMPTPPNAAEKSDDGDKGPKALIFADADPIRVRFNNEQVLLTIRAGFKREDKADIPAQVVTVPLNFVVKGDNVVVTRGDVSVSPVNKPASVAEQVALAGVVRKKIESALPTRNLSRKFRLKQREGNVDATISQAKALDGWFTLVLQ